MAARWLIHRSLQQPTNYQALVTEPRPSSSLRQYTFTGEEGPCIPAELLTAASAASAATTAQQRAHGKGR
ncbi:hypothetical protein GLOTRDRAFT_99904, partial [Gloeophyllum trabeum ATCC 11539]